MIPRDEMNRKAGKIGKNQAMLFPSFPLFLFHPVFGCGYASLGDP